EIDYRAHRVQRRQVSRGGLSFLDDTSWELRGETARYPSCPYSSSTSGLIGRLAMGQRVLRNTRSDVVPRRPSRNRSGPSVVITIRSAFVARAVSRMTSVGTPSLTTWFQVQPVSSGIDIDGISAELPA